MLTARGWWVLTLAVLAGLPGLLLVTERSTTVPILGLTLLVWFVAQWVVFAARYRSTVSRVHVTRALVQGGRDVVTAWAKVPCRVRVTVSVSSGLRCPLVFAEDRLPVGHQPVEGTNASAGDLSGDSPAVIEYGVRPEAPGVLRFEGVTLRVTDLCGFFYRRAFVRARVEYIVLPQLADDEGRQRADKRFNTLPPPGVHRLRRPGSGSELLDLRDYRPGDPPKMIAWKASARRDRLITKEYESDVPVRSVLFLDTSQGVRAGPPNGAPIARLVEVAAAVAQASAGNRDLVGLTTFDETTTTVLRPARTQAHTVRLLGRLAESAALLPDRTPGTADALLKAAHPVAQEIYPDLMADDLNSRPLGMHWVPLLDSRWGWLIFIPFAIAPLLAVQARWFNACADFINSVRPRFNVVFVDVGVFVFLLFAVLFLPSVLALLFWFVYGVRGFFEPRRTRTRKRKQLAATFATLDRDTLGAVERYLKDDSAFAERAGRFLADHRIQLPGGDGRQPDPEQRRKIDQLATALLRSVLAARDNELYVVLADLTDFADGCDPLVRAVRVARARHHHVLVIVPWPDDVPVPGGDDGRKRPVARPIADGKRGRLRVAQLVQLGLIRQYQRRFTRLRTDLTRVGATVLRLSDQDPVRVALDRLDRLRGARTRR